MRAPKTKPALDERVFYSPERFSEAQWREIKASLAGCGVDLDAMKVGEFVPGKQQWWLPNKSDAQRPLRNALKDVALHYGTQARYRSWLKGKVPTPSEQAKNWQKQRTAIEKALKTIYRTEMAYPTGDLQAPPEVRLAEIAAEPVCHEMDRRIAELTDQITELNAHGSQRNQNARTVHNDYWLELGRLWRGIITGNGGKFPRQQLRRFLLACTSQALFPDLASRELEQTVDSFVARFFR